jgi:hypothetical protein
MTDFVKNHALANVWCEPSQDRQHNIRLHRLTPNGGKRTRVRVAWEDVKLPDVDTVTFWHVFQIGQLHPELVNAIKERNVWKPVSQICEENNLQIDIFAGKGIQIPKTTTYMRWTHDNNLILCTKLMYGFANHAPQPLLESETFYIRFYSNAYYDTNDWMGIAAPTTPIRVIGGLVTTQESFVALRQQWNQVINAWNPFAMGAGMWFLDGYAITVPGSFVPATMSGKYLEFVWDASIRNQYREMIPNIESFISSLDGGEEKFLVMPFVDSDLITFEDDVDVYLGYVAVPGGPYVGVYLNTLAPAAIRMVTHNAYSILKQNLLALVSMNPFITALANCRLIVNIRNGGMKPGLIYQHNRIKELYRLPRATRIGAMIGVNATIPEWTADQLESSAYCLIMGKKAEEITPVMVEAAYGYNAMAKYFADAYAFPLVQGNQCYAELPPALCVPHPVTGTAKRSVFSYDLQGKYIGQTNNTGLYNELPVNAFIPGGQPFLFEMMATTASDTLDGCLYPFFHEFTIVSGQINGLAPPPVVNGATYLCTTTGGAFLQRWLYKGEGGVWEPAGPVSNERIFVVSNLIGGVITKDAGHYYRWSANATAPYFGAWVDLGTSNTNVFTETVVETYDLKHYGFRCYACSFASGSPDEVWQDITGNTNYYTYSESGTPTLTWNITNLMSAQLFPCVKIANNILFYRVPLEAVVYPGFVRFSVNSTVRWGGVTQQRVQTIPPGTIDIMMDGENLMENIDYYVQWPQIVVVKKPNRTPSEGLQVMVRCAGYCDPTTMAHHAPREIGFVKGGLVSVDGQFNVRNDRVSRIIVGGSVRHPTQVRFVEEGNMSLAQDGLPYTINDVFVPMEHFTTRDTVDYREVSVNLDEDVQNYLGVHLPEDTPNYPIIVNEKWAVYSPFMAAIIKSVQDALPTQAELELPWNNVDVAGWVSQFIYLLDYDPCVIGVNENYIDIDPHHYNAGPKEGGVLTVTGVGTNFNITAGFGYVVSGGIHTVVNWSAQAGICPQPGINYIGVDETGTLVITDYLPNLINYIALGQILTDVTNATVLSSGPVFNQAIPVSQEQYAYLEYVNTHYLFGKLDLTHFLTIGS